MATTTPKPYALNLSTGMVHFATEIPAGAPGFAHVSAEVVTALGAKRLRLADVAETYRRGGDPESLLAAPAATETQPPAKEQPPAPKAPDTDQPPAAETQPETQEPPRRRRLTPAPAVEPAQEGE